MAKKLRLRKFLGGCEISEKILRNFARVAKFLRNFVRVEKFLRNFAGYENPAKIGSMKILQNFMEGCENAVSCYF